MCMRIFFLVILHRRKWRKTCFDFQWVYAVVCMSAHTIRFKSIFGIYTPAENCSSYNFILFLQWINSMVACWFRISRTFESHEKNIRFLNDSNSRSSETCTIFILWWDWRIKQQVMFQSAICVLLKAKGASMQRRQRQQQPEAIEPYMGGNKGST